MSETREKLLQKIKSLSELVWEHRIHLPEIELWLDNFTGQCLAKDQEQDQALYLLSKFLFYGRARSATYFERCFGICTEIG